MSIILDALRRGRGAEKPASTPTAAHTQAVLQTLGYARFDATTPRNRLKRLLTRIVLGKWKAGRK